ncbi:hypothetical protein ABTD34_08945 [Acinetobacter baumannii]
MMKCIKTKDDLLHLYNEAIKDSISNHMLTLEQQYDEPYQARACKLFCVSSIFYK